MKSKLYLVFSLILCLFLFDNLIAQEELKTEDLNGLKFRNIGPAFMSGRIADIAINPNNESEWYVAVGSGGVWKTQNAGTTFHPIFDNKSVYSTGCITIDPHNSNKIWLGTGENVGGRHVSIGDGIYVSEDGGQNWTNMGLQKSEHISKIIVHPKNPKIVWVASQGPLWSKGGERGIYMTEDGGQNWTQVLGDNEWTGATDLQIDPRNPDILYAATWDRHRTVAAYMGGGPGTGLYKSEDGGRNWKALTERLPKSNMGKIGLAISPHKPDIIYAAIELDRRKGGVYKSINGGMSWKKMSDAVSGATGPHYYQELYACPHHFDRLYLMDVRIQISDDGGKTFRRLNEEHKHSDNHAIAFKQNDPNYLLVGTDGGIYETYDNAQNWRFFSNLPLTQFYKIAVDDSEPFYNVYGGTQDNSTEGGPSRTDKIQGIQNSDWSVVLNWDGHQPATEPGNPNVVYSQRQEGTLSRIDMSNGQVVDIQPQAKSGEAVERFNWDAPILVSPHKPERIYFASQRLWKSEDRGDSWEAISSDLTRNENRVELEIMGRKQSYNNPWDISAMSNYNTITSISESPVQENLIYIGTDDGILQITKDGGQTWAKTMLSQIPGVPERSYINDIKADLYDVNTVYMCLDNHKEGDYKPMLLRSQDQGLTWTKITNGISDPNIIWRIVQDHINSDLLFLATEFGIYFSPDKGDNWMQLKGDLPTISFRDITIQRREGDLVCGSFGRSIYIFDDINVFRYWDKVAAPTEGSLFPTRDALWYIPRSSLGFDGKRGNQGAAYYVADNPDFGAVFTYYLKDGFQSAQEQRKAGEKELNKEGTDVPFPGWDTFNKELKADKPAVLLTIKNDDGQIIRRIKGPETKGFHRVAWDLRFPAPDFVLLNPPTPGEWAPKQEGLWALPGNYTAQLSKWVDGMETPLSGPISFKVKAINTGTLSKNSLETSAEFWREYEEQIRQFSHVSSMFGQLEAQSKSIQMALIRSQSASENISGDLKQLKAIIYDLGLMTYGNTAKEESGEKSDFTIGSKIFTLNRGLTLSTYGPTETHKVVMEEVKADLSTYKNKIAEARKLVKQMAQQILDNGGPRIEGVDY